ncbi:DUF2541 family protein [Enterovibrio nigricans]|uniref:DUF2541 domain-containing protein n=1 Tax=Enterovibrio nigricans DSM 22720 TaxID=1121868 RepID=A0A1T4VSD7_9GAMM|nr:DUF2541 family protein [Enterovibrio nigricans]SKA67883.1 Protein of unknown function [Enterovibrio nigricans DSM 22720]
MNKKTLLSVMCVLTGLMGVSSAAHADDKFTLGRTILLENANHGAEIPLLVCRRTDAIQVEARKDLHLRKVVVTFNNGETKTIRFHRKVKEDGTTDWRKFAYKRCVKKLEVFGESKNSSAGVRVYGRD